MGVMEVSHLKYVMLTHEREDNSEFFKSVKKGPCSLVQFGGSTLCIQPSMSIFNPYGTTLIKFYFPEAGRSTANLLNGVRKLHFFCHNISYSLCYHLLLIDKKIYSDKRRVVHKFEQVLKDISKVMKHLSHGKEMNSD